VQCFNPQNPKSVDTIISATSVLIDTISNSMSDLTINELGIFLIVLLNPFLQYPEHQNLIIPRLCIILTTLSSKERLEFQSICNDSVRSHDSLSDPSTVPPTYQATSIFRKILATLQQFINIKIQTTDGDEPVEPAYKDFEIINAAQSLEIFYILNEIARFVPYYEFYNENIEKRVDLKEDYPRWKGREGYYTYNLTS
jgi:hypothetical protein